MKNKFVLTFAGTLLLATVLGCGMNPLSDKGSTSSNKSLTDKTIDTVTGGETTGVPECDEVLDMISKEMDNPDDGYLVKAAKSVFLNKFKEGIRQGIADSQNKNTQDMTKTCADIKKEIIKYKAEQEKQKQ